MRIQWRKIKKEDWKELQMLSRNRAQQLAIKKTIVLLPKHYPEVITDSPSSTTTNTPLLCLTLSHGIFALGQQMKYSHLPAIPSSLLHYNLGKSFHWSILLLSKCTYFSSLHLFTASHFPPPGCSPPSPSAFLRPHLQIHLCHYFLPSHYSPLIS